MKIISCFDGFSMTGNYINELKVTSVRPELDRRFVRELVVGEPFFALT
ncbi:MAG: hypothetical protein ACXWMF_13515 [Syntrophales bacterium]